MGRNSKCCKKYERKAKACSGCPVLAVLSRKQRKKLLAKARCRRGKAA